jgi:hypothetical protein
MGRDTFREYQFVDNADVQIEICRTEGVAAAVAGSDNVAVQVDIGIRRREQRDTLLYCRLKRLWICFDLLYEQQQLRRLGLYRIQEEVGLDGIGDLLAVGCRVQRIREALGRCGDLELIQFPCGGLIAVHPSDLYRFGTAQSRVLDCSQHRLRRIGIHRYREGLDRLNVSGADDPCEQPGSCTKHQIDMFFDSGIRPTVNGQICPGNVRRLRRRYSAEP